MNDQFIENQDILKLASMRFKTVVAEVADPRHLNLNLTAEAGVQGFIVLLRPALPSID